MTEFIDHILDHAAALAVSHKSQVRIAGERYQGLQRDKPVGSLSPFEVALVRNGLVEVAVLGQSFVKPERNRTAGSARPRGQNVCHLVGRSANVRPAGEHNDNTFRIERLPFSYQFAAGGEASGNDRLDHLGVVVVQGHDDPGFDFRTGYRPHDFQRFDRGFGKSLCPYAHRTVVEDRYRPEVHFFPFKTRVIKSECVSLGQNRITVFVGDLEPVNDHRAGWDVATVGVGPLKQLAVHKRSRRLIDVKIGVLRCAPGPYFIGHADIVDPEIRLDLEFEPHPLRELRCGTG